MRVVHLDLDYGALIPEEIHRLVLVSRLDLDPRLPHHDVAGVHALAQLDNRALLCCLDGLPDGPVFPELGVHDDLFRVFNLGRAPVGQLVPGAVRSDPCYALMPPFNGVMISYRLTVLRVTIRDFVPSGTRWRLGLTGIPTLAWLAWLGRNRECSRTSWSLNSQG